MSYGSQNYSSQQQQQNHRGPGAHHPITGAANNGGGLIRITSAGHGLVTGNTADIQGVVGTTEANKLGWIVTLVDANNVDLQSSVFANAYVSGGVINRV